jgi:flavodoxin
MAWADQAAATPAVKAAVEPVSPAARQTNRDPIMPVAKTLVICKSVHHHGTARIAGRIADVLGAAVMAPEEVPGTALDRYDFIGFGSGIYYGTFHEAVWSLVRSLPDQAVAAKPAFVFSTAGLSCLWKLWHGPFKKELARKGFDVVGEFHCRGFDSWGPLGLAGGINRRHPDERDLKRAERFATDLARRMQPAVAGSASA